MIVIMMRIMMIMMLTIMMMMVKMMMIISIIIVITCVERQWGGNILGDRDHDYYDADDYYDHDGQLIMVVMLMVMISTTCAEPQGGVEASWVDLFVHAERNQRGT